MNMPIYFDYNATTPMDPRVYACMEPYFRQQFGNPASRHHSLGCEAAKAVERARAQLAALIGADPREIIWTSGATEADNAALKGIAASPIHGAKGKHIVTVRTEHKAVLDTSAHLRQNGCDLTYLAVDRDGCIDLHELAESITANTMLVSIMHANNETGVLHPLAAIGELCKSRGVLFHTDATQSVGKEPVDVEADGIDLLSMSAHKMYGPKGVGALYVRRRRPRVRCEPIMHGGGHERGVRSGTLNVPGIVGFGETAAICAREMNAEQMRIRKLRDDLHDRLVRAIPEMIVNGHVAQRLANTLNVSFPGLDGDALMKSMPDVAVSASSACTSAVLQPSFVLGAMGATEAEVRGSVRFSIGRFTTAEEVAHVAMRVIESVAALRQPSHQTSDN